MTAVDVSLLGAGALTLTVADEKVTAYAAAEAIASRLGLADGGCHALCVATDGELGFERVLHGAAMLAVVAGLRRDASGPAQRLVFWRALAPPPPAAAVPPNPCEAADVGGPGERANTSSSLRLVSRLELGARRERPARS